ncbi:MAG: ribonuclease R [Coxiella sp. RIFCSPHIGHO2_12_FULL_42_15]|nr:MAG: ribonuclease R [Coxiella sp. RIFCSPHIGHO2_12_FULL_42_15]
MGKRKKQKSYHKGEDPYLQREAGQYEHPVPSREFILQYLEERGRPTSFNHLMKIYELSSSEEREGLRRRLIAMARDGQIISNRRGSYALVSKLDLIRGHVQAHRDGFGFLIPDDGSDDVFLPAREMRGVFNDDVILVRIADQFARRKEGVVVEVLERNTHQVVGRFFEENGYAFVDPDSKYIVQDIAIPPGAAGNAKVGQFVVAEITAQPTKRRQPVGKIIEILGDHLTPGMEVELAIRAHELPFQWPSAVTQEAQRFHAQVQEVDKQNRLDLRTLAFVTIDGEDAKDFDDAVYCEYTKEKGWKLYVAIADVSHYVRPHMALDHEAQLRGNSVYFPAKVIPMLPETLSNGLCSLKPNEDRLTLTCVMNINEDGEIEDFKFHETVIHSQARLTYTEVFAMLNGEKTPHQAFYSHLKRLYDLYKKLLQQRILRGAIEFESQETKIKFDDKGKIAQIVPIFRNDAHRLIEEMMLAANICAAHYLLNAKIPALYRIHEGPQAEKLLALRDFLKNFNLRLTGGAKPTTKDYANLLTRIVKRDDSHLLQTILLRSLQQAIYSTDNVGHFGLAYDAYTHFTSPIRRYPDLLVHRTIKHKLQQLPKKAFPYNEENMEHYAEHCSMTERRADRATRDAIDWLKCEYMQDKVGQEFEGRIVDVTGFGIFVELNDIYVQGLVHVTSLYNDYYHYDSTLRLLRGKRTGKEYRLADSLRILVARVDLDERTIDFEPAEER